MGFSPAIRGGGDRKVTASVTLTGGLSVDFIPKLATQADRHSAIRTIRSKARFTF